MMLVSIQSSGVELSNDLKIYIQRKLQLAFSRLEPYIIKISISLTSGVNTTDSNKHCRLAVTMVNQPDVVVEDTQMDLDFVIDRVLHKATRMIERLVLP